MMKHKWSIRKRVFYGIAKVFLFLGVLAILGLCVLVSPFFAYSYFVSRDAMSLMPPVYSNSVEVISGQSMYAGNSGFAAIWVYCTDDSISELIAYFEPT